MWASLLEPSKQRASRRPFPSILRTCAYSERVVLVGLLDIFMRRDGDICGISKGILEEGVYLDLPP